MLVAALYADGANLQHYSEAQVNMFTVNLGVCWKLLMPSHVVLHILAAAFFPNGWQYGHTSWTCEDDLIRAQEGPLPSTYCQWFVPRGHTEATTRRKRLCRSEYIYVNQKSTNIYNRHQRERKDYKHFFFPGMVRDTPRHPWAFQWNQTKQNVATPHGVYITRRLVSIIKASKSKAPPC